MALDRKEYRILVIEDNPGDFALVEDHLHDQIEAPLISHAESFTIATSLIIGSDGKFDVILLDLSLPDKTGEPLINEIVGLAAHTPVIVLTGYTDFDFGVRSLSLGVSDYMLKDELTALSLYKSIVYSSGRKKALAALEESEKKYSDQFNFSPLPTWVVDPHTRKFLDVNLATITHYGYSREEFMNMTLQDIRPVENLAELEEVMGEVKAKGATNLNKLVTHKKKNGDVIKVDIQISHLIHKGIEANIIIATDVTERLAHLNKIEEQNKRFREISWMQSHVIRAPLSRMLGLMNLFKENCADKDQVMEYLMQSANELDEVIKSITDVSNSGGKNKHS